MTTTLASSIPLMGSSTLSFLTSTLAKPLTLSRHAATLPSSSSRPTHLHPHSSAAALSHLPSPQPRSKTTSPSFTPSPPSSSSTLESAASTTSPLAGLMGAARHASLSVYLSLAVLRSSRFSRWPLDSPPSLPFTASTMTPTSAMAPTPTSPHASFLTFGLTCEKSANHPSILSSPSSVAGCSHMSVFIAAATTQGRSFTFQARTAQLRVSSARPEEYFARELAERGASSSSL
mmetsp:Transcript_1375/g.2467  ORF Transcript_1375/g.2467 Transcript_1375/m.2467 type:complete len:233 (-) Transcript_1375:420-1118(-)